MAGLPEVRTAPGAGQLPGQAENKVQERRRPYMRLCNHRATPLACPLSPLNARSRVADVGRITMDTGPLFPRNHLGRRILQREMVLTVEAAPNAPPGKQGVLH